MDIEPRQQPRLTRVSDTEREAAVGALKRASAEGRLRLEEFSDRVGIALAADTIEQLEGATANVDTRQELPAAGPVSSVLAVLGDRRQVGRWRLPRLLRAYGLLGDVHLDLRDVIVGDEVVEIHAVTFFGNLCVDVPEGVEVELYGFDILGDRDLRLARVPRRPGTPLIRIRAHGILGDVDVRTPMPGEEPPSWWAWFKGSRRRRRVGRELHAQEESKCRL